MNYSPYLLKKHALEQASDFVTCKDKNCIEINSNNNKFYKLEDFLTQNNFNFEKDIKGKVGKFNISENKVIQKLRIYKIYDGNFTEYNF